MCTSYQYTEPDFACQRTISTRSFVCCRYAPLGAGRANVRIQRGRYCTFSVSLCIASGNQVLAYLQVIVKMMAQGAPISAPHLDFLVVWPRSMGCKPALLDQNTIPTETTKMTYKMPEKQKILPIPNKTLKMIGTAKPPKQEAYRQQKVQCSPYPCI